MEIDDYKALLVKDDPDYAQLDQGKFGTEYRHNTVVDALGREAFHGVPVVDFGCGTGLILETISARGWTPSAYFGMDMLTERREHVFARGKKLGIEKVEFLAVPPEVGIEYLSDLARPGRTGLCIGVAGYDTIRDNRGVSDLVDALRDFSHWSFTLPAIRETMGLGERGVTFDPDDLPDLGGGTVIKGGRDLVIYR
jgi:SAM-dependent methyltransferase